MNKTLSVLIGSTAIATGLTVISGSATPAMAYALSSNPACNTAAAVFNPVYDACVGAYLLGTGENDVTDGDDDNIVNQLLNNDSSVESLFGADDWTFLEKVDVGVNNGSYFDITSLNSNSTNGSIEFDVSAIEAAFGTSFLSDYEIAVSFKAATNFSIYQWDAPLGVDTIDWSTAGTATNRRGNPQGLSHASVYFRRNDNTPDPVSTPEPGTAGVMALLALGGVISWKKQKF
jgi:hypothetical protein